MFIKPIKDSVVYTFILNRYSTVLWPCMIDCSNTHIVDATPHFSYPTFLHSLFCFLIWLLTCTVLSYACTPHIISYHVLSSVARQAICVFCTRWIAWACSPCMLFTQPVACMVLQLDGWRTTNVVVCCILPYCTLNAENHPLLCTFQLGWLSYHLHVY